MTRIANGSSWESLNPENPGSDSVCECLNRDSQDLRMTGIAGSACL